MDAASWSFVWQDGDRHVEDDCATFLSASRLYCGQCPLLLPVILVAWWWMIFCLDWLVYVHHHCYRHHPHWYHYDYVVFVISCEHIPHFGQLGGFPWWYSRAGFLIFYSAPLCSLRFSRIDWQKSIFLSLSLYCESLSLCVRAKQIIYIYYLRPEINM